MTMMDDSHLNQIEKWFIQMEQLPMTTAKKLAKVYFEYDKPHHGAYDEFFFKGYLKYKDNEDWGI